MQSLGYTVLVADWGQGWDKSVGDIDEISEEAIASIQLVAPEKAFADIPSLKTKADKFSDWVANQTKRFKPKGFGAPKITGNKFNGDRREEWRRAIERGQAFLDASFMGSGKSHTVPQITNPYGGVIWYVYGDHRNPTVEEIADEFVDLYPRNSKGFYQDENGKIKPADGDHKATITKGKCTRAELFPMLTNLGHDPNDGGGSNPICQSCPMANTCCHTSGWYRHDRRQALKSGRIRCHIDSMPREWDYSKDIILIDEPSQLLTPTRKITAGWKDLLVEADQIRPTLEPELWQELDGYLQVIKPLFEAKGYGLSHAKIVEKLPTISPELTTAIAAYQLDLTSLFPEAMEETIADNLNRQERKKWAKAIKAYNEQQRKEQATETITNLEQLPPKALAHLLTGNGIARIQSQALTITLDRRADYAFLNRAASIGFLDATIDGDRLQTISGLDREIQIIHNTPDKPLSNLTIKQIKVQGIASKNISDTALNRLHAIIQTFGDMPTIGLKAWANKLDLDGYWWRDSRGTNDFAGIHQLLAIGLPNPNLGAIEDDYLALYGNLDQFEEHYARLVNEEIFQLIGRQRANRYPDLQFELIIITPEKCDLSWVENFGITLKVKAGFEICPSAGTQTQQTRWHIVQAILDGCRNQTAISQAIGLTQQAISKTLKAAGVTVEKLVAQLEQMLPEMATTTPYGSFTRPSCSDSELMNQFRELFELDLVEVLADVIKHIEENGWTHFLEFLSFFPQPAQARCLAVLYPFLDTGPPAPV
jgi:hypothetical protein